MRKIRFLAVLIGLVVGLCVATSQTVLAADEQLPPGVAKQGKVPGKGLHKGWVKGKHKGWEKKAGNEADLAARKAEKEKKRLEKEAEKATRKAEKEAARLKKNIGKK